jgi:glycosyltransferase involved in cell wall biosynthesis
LVKEIHKFNPDIVHSHGTEGPYALSGIKCKCPCIISIQGIISELFKVSPALTFCIVGYLEQLEVRKGRYFACRTQFDTNFVLSHNKQARIFALDEAMGPIFFECDWKLSDSQKILFVGSLIRRKGVKTVLEALALVMNEFPRVSLYLIGDGERNYIEYLRNLSKKLGIQKNVEFLGFKSGMEIAKFYVESQLFVFPSENDNSPNSVAEAMVSGMPVIATRVGGIPSMIEDGQTGLLVEPNNPQELAEKIIHLLSKPNERKRLGDNAKNVARSRHLPDKVAENTIETYRHILDLEGRKYISAK